MEDERVAAGLNGRLLVLSVGAPEADAKLVARARAGDRDAFETLYRRYRATIRGVMLASVPRTAVGDLVQDVFLRAWAQLSSLRRDGAFGPWLLSICRRRAADFHRHGDRTPPPPGPVVEHPYYADGLAILQAIRRLPPAYRETLALRLVEGMTGPEIAARTGKTERSVRVHLCRGMKMLREQLRGEEP